MYGEGKDKIDSEKIIMDVTMYLDQDVVVIDVYSG